MREKIAALNNSDLLKLAKEMTLTMLPEDSIARTLMPEELVNYNVAFFLIEINTHLVQVLAERFNDCLIEQ